MTLRTCVAPTGTFRVGVHTPAFRVKNLRQHTGVTPIGVDPDGELIDNHRNFPEDDVDECVAEPVFEVANAFPFKGATYILKRWADTCAEDPARIRIAEPMPVSMARALENAVMPGPLSSPQLDRLFDALPPPVKLALAATSTDPQDLVRLARSCCRLCIDPISQLPTGLHFRFDSRTGHLAPDIYDPVLFDAVANNPNLPDSYKDVMVLRPGVQGASEIVGEWTTPDAGTRVLEYLRRNSYIPWGHYAANMGHRSVRYCISDLRYDDMVGMRHLYYQRTYVRLAAQMGVETPESRCRISENQLEALRRRLTERWASAGRAGSGHLTATLWGWNFGYGVAASGYRLHASHQQIHQQFAMIPDSVGAADGDEERLPTFACGDLIGDFARSYRRKTGALFFDAYLRAIRANRRIDGRADRENSLIVYEDDTVLLFVPKAQTSQWELQLMAVQPIGHILEAPASARRAIDRGLFIGMKVLSALGAAMITVLEYAKRFDSLDPDHRLIYAFLPRLPESPGGFSEAQLRFINGHYPEDFAAACRAHVPDAVTAVRGAV
jgi:hypothetical protein